LCETLPIWGSGDPTPSLNELGEKGWELVTSRGYGNENQRDTLYMFKREEWQTLPAHPCPEAYPARRRSPPADKGAEADASGSAFEYCRATTHKQEMSTEDAAGAFSRQQ
jgi:hypothetical protein